MGDAVLNPERAIRWFDDRQQQHWWLGFPVGVVRKFTDDQGGGLAALVTFHVFVGLLPLLVVLLTVFGRVLEGSEALRDAALDSAFGQMPVVGDRIRADVSALVATGPVLVVSVAGLVWTATGIYTSLQQAMNQVWNVPGVDRQGFVSRQLRALAVFLFVFVAAAGTAPLRDRRPPLLDGLLLDLFGTAVHVLTSALVLLVVLRLVTAPTIGTRLLLPAALLAGLFWTFLQRLGTTLLVDQLTEASDLYGALAVVVVTLFWINLLARSVVLANEWAVVGWRRLWPRRIAQPPLTDADRRVVEALVGNERRRPEAHIHVTWDDAASGSTPTPAEAAGADGADDPHGAARAAEVGT